MCVCVCACVFLHMPALGDFSHAVGSNPSEQRHTFGSHDLIIVQDL